MLTKSVVAALLCAVLALAVTACGSSGGSSSSSEPSETGTEKSQSGETQPAAEESEGGESFQLSSELAASYELVTGNKPLTAVPSAAELKSRVEAAEETPPGVLVTQPVKKKAEPGKDIAMTVCGIPTCQEFYEGLSAAAAKLGWKTTKIDLGLSPEEFKAAYTRAVELKPDLVIGSGVSSEYFAPELKELEALNIPVIQWSSGNEEVPGKVFVAIDKPIFQAIGMLGSEWIASESEMEGHAVFFNIEQYPTIGFNQEAMVEYLPQICPKCSIDTQAVPVSDIGKLGPTVTGYIQQHPEVNYVFCGTGDLCDGVGQALKAAGQEGVKVMMNNPSETGLQDIQSGYSQMGIPLTPTEIGWQLIDLSQRIFNEEETEQSTVMPLQIVTEVEDPASKSVGAPANFEGEFESLWKIGG